MNEKTQPVKISVGWHGNTVYVIEHATSEDAKETSYEKVKRLIMNEPIVLKKEA